MGGYNKLILTSILVASLLALPVSAQITNVPFGQGGANANQPLEIVSDSFSISQSNGTAEFLGNVVVGQGDMRLSAGKILVEYTTATDNQAGAIGRMIATGGVTLVNGAEAAEANTATYEVSDKLIILEGNVLVTQGQSALSGQKFTINLASGSANFEGRVKTIFQAEPAQ